MYAPVNATGNTELSKMPDVISAAVKVTAPPRPFTVITPDKIGPIKSEGINPSGPNFNNPFGRLVDVFVTTSKSVLFKQLVWLHIQEVYQH